jgi:hypothetical protein
MPELTHRRSPDHRHKCWHIYYGDVHVGTIAVRGGNPQTPTRGNGTAASIQARSPGEHQSGTAATFEEARADFERAWQVFFSKRTDADFR